MEGRERKRGKEVGSTYFVSDVLDFLHFEKLLQLHGNGFLMVEIISITIPDVEIRPP